MIIMKNARETFQKAIVYEKTLELANHPTAEEVYAAVRTIHPNISMGTVYRNLNRLAEEGKLKKIDIPNAPSRFDHQLHAHQHLKCRICGELYDVDADCDAVLKDLAPAGFKVESYQIIFYGVCQKCNKEVI
jgi:Fe2+ or Zn2+ uptake regulation protein